MDSDILSPTELTEDRVVVRIPTVLIPDNDWDSITMAAGNSNYYNDGSERTTNCCGCGC
jgi:hypothetical protein